MPIEAQATLIAQLLRSGDHARALQLASDPLNLARPGSIDRIDRVFFPYPRAREHWLRALRARFPHDLAICAALAAQLHTLGQFSAAIACCEEVLAADPGHDRMREVRALALIERGDVEQGLPILRELAQTDAAAAARHLVVMHYDPAQTNAGLFNELDRFAVHHLPRLGAGFTRRAHDPDKVLRIGWVSPRLGEGPVARFLAAPLRAFDRHAFEHVLVCLQPVADEAGARLAQLADHATQLTGLDDEALLMALRQLELDVVIDLSGHATSNRLAVLAQRVAPLQVSWLDWFNTTAVPAMDAWLSDRWLTPAGSDQRYSERLLRLETGRFCFEPPLELPVQRAPGAGLVLASFNRLAKLNEQVVATWADILHALPDACLELRARGLDEPGTQAHLRSRFTRHGIRADRLRLFGRVAYRDLLEAYQQVDLVLDPFPFSGCTTTCDALWMGCPVITLAGATLVSRQSASLLQRLGHEDWVAGTAQAYVERACALAARVAQLRAGRAELREAVRARLCDGAAQAAELASTIRALWRERCA